MDRQQILSLYEWRLGICFRHPGKGTVATAVVKELHPQGAGAHDIRACEDCVIALEDIRREHAARTGSEYRPGPVDQAQR